MGTSNDSFGAATVINIDTNGDTFIDSGFDMQNNGMQAGEITIPGSVYNRTAWWSYTPASSGNLTVDTTASTTMNGQHGYCGFKAYQARSDGSIPDNYDAVAGASNVPFSLTFPVTAGTTYYIQLMTTEPNPPVASGGVETGPQMCTLIVTGPATDTYGPVVVLDPIVGSVPAGQTVTLNSSGFGRPMPTLQWQSDKPVGFVGPHDWTDIPGATSSPLTFTASLTNNGMRYRAKFTSVLGEAISDVATLTVTTANPNNPDPIPPPPPDPTPPLGSSTPYPDPFKPGATVPPSTPGTSGDTGSATILDLIRQFSAQVRRPVRLTGPNSIQMVNVNAPLPSGWSQTDAASLYSSSQWSGAASQKVLTLRAGDLTINASGRMVTDDVRLVASTWRLPDPLPVYGLGRAAPVQRVQLTFSPTHFQAEVEFALPAAPAITRR